MKSQTKLIILLIALIAFGFSASNAKEKSGQRTQALAKTANATSYQLMNANNVTSWVRGDGFFRWQISESWNGEFPRASGVGGIYAEGIVFGGFVRDGLFTQTLRVTGDTYFSGMQPGSILTGAGGNTIGADNIDDPSVRTYAVRPDMPPTIQNTQSSWPDLSVDAATFNQVSSSSVSTAQIQAVATQYFTDWNEWPASKGAPWYVDTVKIVRNDAAYDPANPHHIPGIPGASKTIWFVCNDLDPAVSQIFAGSPPMGMEEQMTLWSYASSTPLNNIIFKQVKLIYKGNIGAPSNSSIDSMYIVQWADGDVGDAGDDYAGSDSSLNLGYEYNSTTVDAKYAAKGLPAPAMGYAFLQGAAYNSDVATDSAVVNFEWVKGKKYFHASPLTAFDYFAANTSISDPDDGVYDGTQQWFNLMRGALPRPQYPAGTPFYTSSGYATDHGIVTSYCLSGDPTAGEGWIDGYDVQAADRRIVSVHGPITMNLHDTAEVVIALVGGIGADNLSSVKVLKYNTTYAQFAFNNLFVLPAPPPNPQVSVSSFDENIVLNWANATAQTIEASDNAGFTFEGYNVYQLPSPSSAKKDWVRIATYDVKGDNVTVIIAPELDISSGVIVTAPVQFGSESGIKRTITIDKDYVRQRPLVNSQEYYYAVSAYSYNPDWNDAASPNKAPFPSLESSPIVVTAVPHIPDPGVRYPTKPGDTLAVTHVSSGLLSEGKVYPIVVAPDKLTGHVYKVTFQPSGNSTVWSVIDSTDNNTVKLSDQSNTTGDADYLVVDGVQVVVYSPTGYRDFAETANASGPLASPVYASYAFNSNGFPNTENYPDEDRPPSDEQVSGAYWGICTGATAANDPSYEYFLSRTLRDGGNNAAFSGRDFEIRFTAAGSEAYDAFGNDAIMHVPFELWNLGYTSATTDDFKMIPVMYDVNLNGVFDLDGEDHTVSGGDNDPETDWIYWYNPVNTAPGTAGYDEFANLIAAGDTAGAEGIPDEEVMARMVLVGWNLGSVNYTIEDNGDTTWFPLNIPTNRLLPETGTIIRISSLKPSTPSDEFIYTATAPTYSADAAKADVDMINVFPNPYYGMNARETSRLNKYVTFNHLPTRATIRIFNLAGILVTTITKDNASSQLATWNLKNQNNLPVASGIYIAHIDMPDLGKSKVLKLAIIQEEQILPTY